MNFPFPMLACLMVFILVTTILRNRATKQMHEANENFMDRETRANATRRKDISDLPYLKIPNELLDNDDIKACCPKELEALNRLSDEKILNLSIYSNTDLKLMYGPQNLDALSKCDDAFTELEHVIIDMTDTLKEAKKEELAVPYLNLLISARTTNSKVYIKLANIYRNLGQNDKISALIDSLKEQDFMMKDSIIASLSNF